MRFSDIIKAAPDPPKIDPEQKQGGNVIKGKFKITKSDDDKHLAFGWASVAIEEDGTQLEDYQGDEIDPADLEDAVYKYVEFSRDGSEMHQRGGVATTVESCVFTKEKMDAMGIPEGTVPEGWWIGFHVTDPDVWAKVKDGTYPMFSIEGTATRVDAS